MNPNYKKVMYINLREKSYAVKMHKDLNDYVGGVALGIALNTLEKENEPLTFNIGPLSGLFPYISKTACVYLDLNKKLQESYGGGSLALTLKNTGLDSIVFEERAEKPVAIVIKDSTALFHELKTKKDLSSFKHSGISGKTSVVVFDKGTLVDSYFSFGDETLVNLAHNKNLLAFSVTGTEAFYPKDPERYKKLYFELLAKALELEVPFAGFLSCAGCPAGCRFSRRGEDEKGVSILARSLVSCKYAATIYKDIPTVFSCLSSLGYYYNHEDLENISEKIGGLKNGLAK